MEHGWKLMGLSCNNCSWCDCGASVVESVYKYVWSPSLHDINIKMIVLVDLIMTMIKTLALDISLYDTNIR